MLEPTWVSVSLRRPKDGQVCLVRERQSVTPMRVTFRASPVARWEVDYSVFQYQFFVEWAPDADEQSEAH
jgi:hypothetical protein